MAKNVWTIDFHSVKIIYLTFLELERILFVRRKTPPIIILHLRLCTEMILLQRIRRFSNVSPLLKMASRQEGPNPRQTPPL